MTRIGIAAVFAVLALAAPAQADPVPKPPLVVGPLEDLFEDIGPMTDVCYYVPLVSREIPSGACAPLGDDVLGPFLDVTGGGEQG
jgi:hypothetical protein